MHMVSLWCYCSLSILVMAGIAVSWLSNENPGSYAAFVAFFTAAIVMFRSTSWGSSYDIMAKVFIPVGSLAAAYLWMVAEEGASVRNPELPQTLLLLILLALANAVLVPLAYGVIRCIRWSLEQS